MNKIILLFVVILFTACESSDDGHKLSVNHYTCSMHPKVKEKSPGKCPICHMNLTKVEFDNESDQSIGKKEKKVFWKCKDFPSVTSEVKEECPLDGTMMISSNSAIGVVAKIKLRKAQMNHFFPEFFPVINIKMNRKIIIIL